MSDEASRRYNESLLMHLRGILNIEALRKAMQAIVDRHGALRSTFSPLGDYQVVQPSLDVELELTDFFVAAGADTSKEAIDWIEGETQKTFDLENGPVLRLRLARVQERYHIFALTVPHVVSDGHSWGVILQEMAALYSAFCQGLSCDLPRPMPLDEQAARYAGLTAPVALEADEAYWLGQFAGSVPTLDLPGDRPRPAIATHNHAARVVKLDRSIGERLKEISKERRSTLFVTLLTAFKVLLRQLSGQSDIVVGINSLDRATVGRKDVVGFGVRPLAIRSKIDDESTFSDYIASVRRLVYEAYEHQGLPVGKLVKKLGLRFDPSRLSFVAVGLNLDQIESDIELFGLDVETQSRATAGSSLDVYLDITEKRGELVLKTNYNQDIFDGATIQRWMEHFRALLESICLDPLQSLAALPQPGWGPEKNDEPSVAGEGVAPLTRFQQLIWAGQQLAPEAPIYTSSGIVYISGKLDYERFDSALQALVNGSDALRTVIEQTDGIARQRVLPIMPHGTQYLDFSTEPDPRARLKQWANERCRIRLPLEKQLFDSALVKLGPDYFGWFANLHHLIADAWSVTLFTWRWCDFYALANEGQLEQNPSLPPFRVYIEHERLIADSRKYAAAEAYWQDKLSREFEPIAFYGGSPVKKTTRVCRVARQLDPERTRKIKELAARNDLGISEAFSLFRTTATLLSAYLFRVSGNRRISIGMPFHNRARKDFKDTIGLFMKILPLHISIQEEDTFQSLSRKVRDEFLGTLRYHEYAVGNPFNKQSYDVECNYINVAMLDSKG